VPDDVRVFPVGRLDADTEGLLAALTHEGRAYAVTDGGHLAAFSD
jgi:16S rRNA U516 pseudouridylate synthase RsuA-like enzyme